MQRRPSDTVILPRELTAENGAKHLLIGEFYAEVAQVDEMGLEAPPRRVPIQWTTIKDIYSKIVKGLEIAPATQARGFGSPDGVHPYCQPNDQKGRIFMIRFDDAEYGDHYFYDETAARQAFAKAEIAWNCQLFATLPRNPDNGEDQEWFYRWAARAQGGFCTDRQAISTIFHHPGNPYREGNPWQEPDHPADPGKVIQESDFDPGKIGPIRAITLGEKLAGKITEKEAIDLINAVINSQIRIARGDYEILPDDPDHIPDLTKMVE